MCKLHVLCKIGITLCSPGGCAMLQGVLCCSIPYSRIAVRGSSAIQGFHLKTEPNRVHENSDQQQLQHPRLWHCSDIAHVVETQLIWWFCAWLLIWFLRTRGHCPVAWMGFWFWEEVDVWRMTLLVLRCASSDGWMSQRVCSSSSEGWVSVLFCNY